MYLYKYIIYIHCRHAHTLATALFPNLSYTLFAIFCRLSVFSFRALFHSVKNSSVIFYPHIPRFSILNLYSNMQFHRIFFTVMYGIFAASQQLSWRSRKSRGVMYDRTSDKFFSFKHNIIIFISTKYFSFCNF